MRIVSIVGAVVALCALFYALFLLEAPDYARATFHTLAWFAWVYVYAQSGGRKEDR